MGIEQNRCGNCGKRGGLEKLAELDGQKIPGSICKKCGFFIADKQSQTFDVFCDDCKKPMGYASVQIPVVHVRTILGKDKKPKEEQVTVIHKGGQRKKYMCTDCSRKRVEKDEHDPDEVLTRYETHCMGGCGKVQGWIDAPEGTENVVVDKDGSCRDCTPRTSEVGMNDKAIDSLAKDVAGNT